MLSVTMTFSAMLIRTDRRSCLIRAFLSIGISWSKSPSARRKERSIPGHLRDAWMLSIDGTARWVTARLARMQKTD